jgi:hypothetical protein
MVLQNNRYIRGSGVNNGFDSNKVFWDCSSFCGVPQLHVWVEAVVNSISIPHLKKMCKSYYLSNKLVTKSEDTGQEKNIWSCCALLLVCFNHNTRFMIWFISSSLRYLRIPNESDARNSCYGVWQRQPVFEKNPDTLVPWLVFGLIFQYGCH